MPASITSSVTTGGASRIHSGPGLVVPQFTGPLAVSDSTRSPGRPADDSRATG